MIGLLLGILGIFVFIGVLFHSKDESQKLVDKSTTVPSASDQKIIPTWEVSSNSDRMDGTQSVSLARDSEDSYKDWVGQSHTPRLVVRCEKAGHKVVYIHLGSPASVESGDGEHRVRLKFDDGKPTAATWLESKDDNALGAWGGAGGLVLQMENHKQLLFEWDPFQTPSRQTALFDLDGLKDAVDKQCK